MPDKKGDHIAIPSVKDPLSNVTFKDELIDIVTFGSVPKLIHAMFDAHPLATVTPHALEKSNHQLDTVPIHPHEVEIPPTPFTEKQKTELWIIEKLASVFNLGLSPKIKATIDYQFSKEPVDYNSLKTPPAKHVVSKLSKRDKIKL